MLLNSMDIWLRQYYVAIASCLCCDASDKQACQKPTGQYHQVRVATPGCLSLGEGTRHPPLLAGTTETMETVPHLQSSHGLFVQIRPIHGLEGGYGSPEQVGSPNASLCCRFDGLPSALVALICTTAWGSMPLLGPTCSDSMAGLAGWVFAEYTVLLLGSELALVKGTRSSLGLPGTGWMWLRSWPRVGRSMGSATL